MAIYSKLCHLSKSNHKAHLESTVKIIRLQRHLRSKQIDVGFPHFYENTNLENKKEIVSSYYGGEKRDSR